MSKNTTSFVLRDLSVSPAETVAPDNALRRGVAKRLGWSPQDVPALHIIKRALDSRRQQPQFVYTVRLDIPSHQARRLGRRVKLEEYRPLQRYRWICRTTPDGPPPVIVGAGPAGLFAALTLAEAGWPPVVLERGRPVEQRSKDVSKLYARGELNPNSNVCFGEGGAGTYSDGKLYTRINDPRVQRFMEWLVELGAKADILVNARPHLGTDKLVSMLQAVRGRLESLGATFQFGACMEDVLVQERGLTGFRLAAGGRIEASRAVLATGHSAREVWERLVAAGVPMEARPFAVGFRVEHPQGLIDELRYGRFAGHACLPAADYRLTHTDRRTQRGVYSFCMCPGGVVVTTPTQPDELCINGMSHASRSGRFANSALVVTVGPEDFAAAGQSGLFGGVEFQRAVERAAYLAGGGSFVAPAARLADFRAGRFSGELGSTSYRRGLCPADLAALYPPAVVESLRAGLDHFERSMPGFVTNEAKLIGVETRTASPIRVLRDETYQAIGAQGLYVAGEGMGYGGGIASAAVDGMRVAESMLAAVGADRELISAS